MIYAAFSFIASVIFTISTILYLRDIRGLRVKLSIGSFIVWSIIKIILLVSIILSGQYNLLPYAVVSFLGVFLAALVSVHRNNLYFSFLDKICCLLAILGLIVWVLLDQAEFGIYLSILIDMLLMLPIIRKVYFQPSTETRLPWFLDLLGDFALLLSMNVFSLASLALPLQQILMNLIIVLLLNPSRRLAVGS